MDTAKPAGRILKAVFKDFTARHSVTSISKIAGMTRQGAFKILKKLESEKLLLLSAAGHGKTSTYIINLNWKNPLTEKILAVLLAGDAAKNQRWAANFSEIEKKVEFSILYGSIIDSPKEAGDIDIISIIPNKKKFVDIEKITAKIQKTQIKKIHALNFTKTEFKKELKGQNAAFIDAVKKGIILFGQDKFIRFIRELKE